MKIFSIWFPAQYGVAGRWAECTLDNWGVWRCGGMYMSAPKMVEIDFDDH